MKLIILVHTYLIQTVISNYLLANVNINKLSVIGPSFIWSFLLMPDMASIKRCQLKHPYRLPLKSIPGPIAIIGPNFNDIATQVYQFSYQLCLVFFLLMPDMASIRRYQLKHPYRLPLKSICGPIAILCPNLVRLFICSVSLISQLSLNDMSLSLDI